MIVLRYLLDYTPGEIADLLEIPRGTVNSRLRRGLDQLGANARWMTRRSPGSLASVVVPGELEARRRSWLVTRQAFEEREELPPRSSPAAGGRSPSPRR